MDANHAVQFKPFYPHSHVSLYNSPVISTTMPNLSLANGLNITTANNINSNNNNNSGSNSNNTTTIGHESNPLNALTTLQASTTNPTLALPSPAQLMPMTALSNIQFQQVHHQTYIEQQANVLQASQQPQSKFLHVHITNQLPTMAQTSMAQMSQNQAQILTACSVDIDGTSSRKSSCISEGAHSKVSTLSDPKPSSTKKSTSQNHDHIKLETASDNNINDLSNKYAIINNGKGFRCLVCNREFTQKGNLKTHAMTHLGPTERPYDCETCGKRFTQKGNRDIHVKIHTGTKDHTCPYCDRGFTQRGNLKTHIRSVHTGEKPFSCGHCGKTFSQKANMLTHYRTHDKNSRFSCNLCGKTFSQKGNLKTHQQRHVT